MKEIPINEAAEIRAVKQLSMETSIVDSMNRYFRDQKGRMGDLELSILDSVKRYFEEVPPRRVT